MNLKETTAKKIIGVLSGVVLGLVAYMYFTPAFSDQFKTTFPDFDIHRLPMYNAIFNTIVSLCLILALYFIKNKNVQMHQRMIYVACFFSIIFLLNYVLYHLISESTKYGGDGIIRIIYLLILFTHIILAAVSFPFILLTLYRGLSGQIESHRKLARIVFPIWLYVAISGVIVYLMISPYYPQS